MAAEPLTITFAQEAQFRSWSKDPLAFINAVVRINDPKGREVPFETRPYQDDCIQRFLKTQVCAVLKARQIGLTTAACALALWLLLFRENRFILVLSKNDEDSKKFLRRIKFMYQRLPPWVKARAPQLVGKWGVHEAEFSNGSVIYSATSSSDHGRGDTPTEVFLDEVGKMRNQEDSWTALVPATEAGGSLWMFGTANGFRDWFHLKWLEWKADPDIDTIFYGWRSVEGRDDTWAARVRRRLGDAMFKREYPETDEEAFVSSGSNVFSVELLLEIEAQEPFKAKVVRGDDGAYGLVEDMTPGSDEGLFVFERPIPGAKYLTSADPSEGLVDGDPSVIQVLRWSATEIVQAAVFRGRLEPEDFADMDHVLSIFYSRASVAVERNNHGHTVLKRLARLRTPNVIRGGAGRAGLWTAQGSKGTNIALTRKALADGHLVLKDQRTIDELLGFQEKITKSGNAAYEGAEHDDHVDALCLGVGYAVTNAPYERPADEPVQEEPPHPYSLEGLMARQLTGTRII